VNLHGGEHLKPPPTRQPAMRAERTQTR